MMQLYPEKAIPSRASTIEIKLWSKEREKYYLVWIVPTENMIIQSSYFLWAEFHILFPVFKIQKEN